MIVKDTGGKDFDPTPAGLHHGICIGVVDIGTHWSEWQGKKYPRRMVILVFELPDLTLEIDGDLKPRWISQRYTLSLSSKANLRNLLESWRGKPFSNEELYKGFDMHNLIGVNAQVNVVHNQKNGNTYANIASVVPLAKSMQKRTAISPPIYFSFDDNTPMPENCPEWITNLIMESEEYNEQGQMNEYLPPEAKRQFEDSMEDIPF